MDNYNFDNMLVLILVLVEHTLRERDYFPEWYNQVVLILVLVEHTLRVKSKKELDALLES